MDEVYVEIVTVRSSVYPAEYRNIELAMIPLRASASTGREGFRRGSGLIEYSLCLLRGCMKEYLLLYGTELDVPAMFLRLHAAVMRWLDNYKDEW